MERGKRSKGRRWRTCGQRWSRTCRVLWWVFAAPTVHSLREWMDGAVSLTRAALACGKHRDDRRARTDLFAETTGTPPKGPEQRSQSVLQDSRRGSLGRLGLCCVGLEHRVQRHDRRGRERRKPRRRRGAHGRRRAQLARRGEGHGGDGRRFGGRDEGEVCAVGQTGKSAAGGVRVQ